MHENAGALFWCALTFDRRAFEICIILATYARLATGLWPVTQEGHLLTLANLLVLTVLAILQEECLGLHLRGRFGTPRRAGSQGVAVGALALPWTFAGLLSSAIRTGSDRGFPTFALQASTAASAAMVVALACAKAPPQQPNSRGEPAVSAPQELPEEKKGRHHGTARLLVSCHGPATGALWGPSGSIAPAGRLCRPSLVARAKADPIASAAGCVAALLGMSSVWTGWSSTGAGNASGAGLGVAVVSLSAAHGLPMVLRCLPNCFTIGEAMVVSGGLALLLWDVLLLGLSWASGWLTSLGWDALGGWSLAEILLNRTHVSLFCELLVAGALTVCLLAAPLLQALFAAPLQQELQMEELSSSWVPRSKAASAAVLAALLAAGASAAVWPAVWALQFAFSSPCRCAILAYWVALLILALPVMDWLSRSRTVPTIIVRKGYHLLAMALFSPALLLEPQLLAISLAIATAALMAVETLRVGAMPGVAHRIDAFMTSFLDSRDSGGVLISHFSLLAGMAAPVWLSAVSTTAPPSPVPDLLLAFSGIVILGVADSAASAIGRAWGQHCILDTRKTWEGTCGGVLCCLAAWLPILHLCGGAAVSRGAGLSGLLLATVGSCLLEAATTQLDNIFLPLHHLALLAACS